MATRIADISTSGLAGLESRLKKISPGSKIELTLGIDRNLSASELALVAQSLNKNVTLTGNLEMGSTPEWPNALRMTFYNPYNPISQKGYAFALPLAVLIIGALGAVGVSAFLGFKLGNVIDALAKYIVPVTLILAGSFVLYGFATRKRA